MAILFSAVTVTTEEEQAEFLVAGIPKNYADLEGWAEFDTLMSRMNTEQEIQVHASACLYGEGEVLDATPEEIAYFHHRVAMDDDFLYDHCNSQMSWNWTSPKRLAFGRGCTYESLTRESLKRVAAAAW